MSKSSQVYKTIEIVKNEINENRAETGATYEQLGAAYGVDKAVIWKIVNKDYEPKDGHNRMALELSPLIPTPACAKCGIVHVAKHRTKHPKPTPTPEEQRERIIKRMVKVLADAKRYGITIEELIRKSYYLKE